MKSAILALLLVLSACSLNGTSEINSTLDVSPNTSTSYDLCLEEEQKHPAMFPGKISLLFYNETRENTERYLAELDGETSAECDSIARSVSCTLTVPEGRETHWVCYIQTHRPDNLMMVVKEIAVVAN